MPVDLVVADDGEPGVFGLMDHAHVGGVFIGFSEGNQITVVDNKGKIPVMVNLRYHPAKDIITVPVIPEDGKGESGLIVVALVDLREDLLVVGSGKGQSRHEEYQDDFFHGEPF